MQPLLTQYTFEHRGTQLVLQPSKLVWWPEQKTLFMADSHFGKAATFRKAGMAVPEGTTSKMLGILSSEIEAFKAATLIVLGDWLHSTVSAPDGFEEELWRWRQRHDRLKFILVQGNHDKRSRAFYDRLAVDVHKEILCGPFQLCHDPVDCPTELFSLCGHLHPSIQIGPNRLKCFWLRENQLVLPAFGEFTGTAKVNLAARESAIAICESNLIEISG